MELTEKQKIGQIGEDLAAKFLVEQGFEVIDRNYRQKWGEIDLIAKKAKNLYFVEVKTVSRENLHSGNIDNYQPEDNIHPWKLKRLARTIETYLLQKRVPDNVDWQLDAIAVYVDREGRALKIERLEDIF